MPLRKLREKDEAATGSAMDLTYKSCRVVWARDLIEGDVPGADWTPYIVDFSLPSLGGRPQWDRETRRVVAWYVPNRSPVWPTTA